MEKLKNCTIRQSSEVGIFHDSRKDIRLLGGIINKMCAKIDELVEANNKLSNEVKLLSNPQPQQ